VESLLEKDRVQLRQYIDMFVKHMLDVGASDIDLGGPAANGFVWYRVRGNKTPHKEMGEYTVDQTNVLFLNLLNRNQMQVLFEEYSLDFSFQLPIEGRDGRRRRFRATMYFDYDHLGLNMRAITDEVRSIKSLG